MNIKERFYQIASVNMKNKCSPTELEDFAETLVAELAKENEWQPIETAPKETEIFIGRFIDGKFRFCRSALIYEHANEFAGETWSGWLWSIDDCNDSIADCPTHWMPLPKPPAIAKGENGC